MRWEELTADELSDLAKRGDIVAVIPIGSLEKHGPHLPLGTDGLVAYEVALRAAEKEPSIVLPPLFYSYVADMRQFPGAINIREDVLLSFLENICEEISRNGFKKILIINGHGGNTNILRLFATSRLTRKTDYSLYILAEPWAFEREILPKIRETSEIGHACEIETSFMLYLYPSLCRMERAKIAKTKTKPLEETPIITPFDWVIYCPEGYVGDPTKATREKGEKLVEAWVNGIIEAIRKIKADESLKESAVTTGTENPP
ncbi:creatininase family protein [Candidatus Bathyarchaeota archaeon]|nr:creatininase family protein [Candidatus Bathyarchaeota archaeon]